MRWVVVSVVLVSSVAFAQGEMASGPPATSLPTDAAPDAGVLAPDAWSAESPATTPDAAAQQPPMERSSPSISSESIPEHERAIRFHGDAGLIGGGFFSTAPFWETGVGMGDIRDTFFGYRIALGARFDLASGFTLRGGVALDAFMVSTEVHEYLSGLDAYAWYGETRNLFMYGVEVEVDAPPITRQIAFGGRLALSCECAGAIPGPLITAGVRARATNLFGGIDLARIDHNNGSMYGFLLTAGVTDRPGKYVALGSVALGVVGVIAAFILISITPHGD